jgi:hypothetical protein
MSESISCQHSVSSTSETPECRLGILCLYAWGGWWETKEGGYDTPFILATGYRSILVRLHTDSYIEQFWSGQNAASTMSCVQPSMHSDAIRDRNLTDRGNVDGFLALFSLRDALLSDHAA